MLGHLTELQLAKMLMILVTEFYFRPLNCAMKYSPYKLDWFSERLLHLIEAHPTISIRTANLLVIKAAWLIQVLEDVNMNRDATL